MGVKPKAFCALYGHRFHPLLWGLPHIFIVLCHIWCDSVAMPKGTSKEVRWPAGSVGVL